MRCSPKTPTSERIISHSYGNDPQMADEDDADFQEALRRSREQTNIQESQLADAMAESVRTHDHEMARDLHRNQLAQIEQDLMNQTSSNEEGASRYMEAELLSSLTSLHPKENKTKEVQWQVVGGRTIKRPLYVPLNFGNRSINIPHDPVQVDINRNNSEGPSEASGPPSLSNANDASRSHQKIPYRPPNLHPSHTTGPSTSDQPFPTTTSSSASRAVNGPESISIPIIPQYRPPVLHQAAAIQYSAAAPTSNEPLVVIDGQNVGCTYGAGGVDRFRAKGVEVVLDFYFNQGIPAVAMLPRNKVDTRSNIANDRVADDPDLLKKLEDQGRLAFTPAGAHDDHFLLSYAMTKDIDLISNDRFQKEIAEQETQVDARKLREFLNEHLIPYTIIHGEFVPHPNRSQLGRSIHHSRTHK